MSDLRLFSYGTLQLPEILQALLGRRWPGVPATLPGYARYRVLNKPYPAILVAATGSVPGLLYSGVNAQDLAHLDSYEGELYERRELSVQVGSTMLSAVGYVLCERHRSLLSTEAWDLEGFEREHLASYLQRVAVTRRAP